MLSTAAGRAACPWAWQRNKRSSRAAADGATAPPAACSNTASQSYLSFGAAPSQFGIGIASS
jgi:hypothetical protein